LGRRWMMQFPSLNWLAAATAIVAALSPRLSEMM
jgi:hypothetical protein